VAASNLGGDVARSMDAVTKELQRATAAALAQVPPIARDAMRGTGTGPTGGNMKLSRFRGGNVRLTQRFRKEPGAVVVSPRGPWGIIESGAGPHGHHPGTRSSQGVKAWSRGRDATFVAVGRKVDDIADAVGEAFGGGSI
jgi:hypothetical protein